MSGLRVALLWPCAEESATVRELAGGLIACGHRPWLITSHRGLPRTDLEHGLEVRRNWRPPERRLARRGYEAHLSDLPASYLSLTHGQADLAHAFDAPHALAAARWATRRGRPAVFSCTVLPDRQWLVARRLRLESVVRAARDCTAVVVTSRFAARALARSLGIRARVIHPGVDLGALAADGVRTESPTILCAGSPGASCEDLRIMLQALAIVRRARPSATLVIDPPPDPALAAALVAEPGVELTALGPELYRRAWVTVLPGRRTAFPSAVVRSLACGAPAVARADGAGAEVIDRPELGRLLRSDDPADAARAILEALELRDDPGSTAACHEQAARFSIERCAAAYEALYYELLAGAAG